jgi:hypothetical protein
LNSSLLLWLTKKKMFTAEIPSAQHKHNFRCRNAISGRPDGCSSCPVRPSPCIPVDCSFSLSNATYPNFLCRTVKLRELPPKRCEVEQQGYVSSAWHQAHAGRVYLGANTASRPAAQFYSPKYIIIIIIITPAQPCKLLFSLPVFITRY